MSARSVLLPFTAAAGLMLAGGACASAQTMATQLPSYAGLQSQVDALATANPSTYSNPAFRTSPPVSIKEAFSGSSEPPAATAPWTGTETNPPGAVGQQAPGAQASGSVLGQAD
jgi:hypothetical protein